MFMKHGCSEQHKEMYERQLRGNKNKLDLTLYDIKKLPFLSGDGTFNM